jgi:intracellular multiplication protein IcmP
MAGQAAQQPQPESSNNMLWLIALVLGVIAIVWYIFKRQIATSYLQIKLYEIKLLSMVPFLDTQELADVYTKIHDVLPRVGKIDFTIIVALGATVGEWTRYPFTLLLILCAIAVYVGNKTHIYKRTYSMQQLAKLEKDNWPQISPVVHLDLIKADINKGPWAMALTPMLFCKKNKLLQEIQTERREDLSSKEWGKVNVVLKRGEANKLFVLQLGPLWKNINSLPPHVKGLFAVFAARINADSKPAANLLLQFNCSPPGKLNMRGVDALIKKHYNTKSVQRIVQGHAYVLTVMASMLEGARQDGVQASADFLWLKPLDRRLWYTLNVVGRQTPFVEVAGIFAHWLAEKEATTKLVVPMIEEATKALELALTEVVYHPDET